MSDLEPIIVPTFDSIRLAMMDSSKKGSAMVEDIAPMIGQAGLPKSQVDELAKLLKSSAGQGVTLPAIKAAVKLAEPIQQGWEGRLQRNDSDAIKDRSHNVGLILGNDPAYAGRLWWDSFRDEPMMGDEPIDDLVASDIMMDISERYSFGPRTSMVFESAIWCCRQNQRNPLTEYLDSLKWDGKSRAECFAQKYLGGGGLQQNKYMLAWLISLVARAYQPGCKVDQMIVLEGKQGIKKSTLLNAIGGEWYLDLSADISTDAALHQMHGYWVVELGELVPLKKAGELATQIISRASDRYRLPYARVPTSRKRTAVFAGTTNADAYLEDATGGRRYLPVPVRAVDIDGVMRDRDQILAEAVDCYRAGVNWWVDDDVMRVDQESRITPDMWHDVVVEHVNQRQALALSARTGANRRSNEISTESIVAALGIPLERADRKAYQRISRIMRQMGWIRSVVMRTDEHGEILSSADGSAKTKVRGYRLMED